MSDVGDFEILERNDGTFSVIEKVAFWNTGKWKNHGEFKTLTEAQQHVQDYKLNKLARQVKQRWVVK